MVGKEDVAVKEVVVEASEVKVVKAVKVVVAVVVKVCS